MEKLPGWEHTERAITALREAGAWIIEGEEQIIFCEERSTLKALGMLRCRGENLAEVKRRLGDLRRFLWVRIDQATNAWGAFPWTGDPTERELIPEDAMILAHRDKTPVYLLEWWPLAFRLGVFSRHPAMIAWVDWLCGDYLPAMQRHGYYNPETNHEPPPSELLDAIERREAQRDFLNHLAPGLGDRLVNPPARDAQKGDA
jgi:hypothetical protein